jgi:peptidoglycan/LPS O-acetylase OafA/YrhL
MVQTSGVSQIGHPELTRRYDVDWLRVLGMMVVFLFHNARFFDTEGWHVKSPRTTPAVNMIVAITVQWMMPLFFILSGIGAYHALARQGWRQYLVSRVKRLVVPLVFGIFVFIAPWQVYLERVSHGQYSGSFWSWYPHYFEGWFGLGGNFAWMGVHLWYLEFLFLFSVLALPLFLILQSRPGDRLVAASSRAATIPGPIFLLAIPIVIMEFVANSPALKGGLLSQRDFGGWSLLPYFAIFILGFLLAGREEMARAMEHHRFAGLAAALLTFVVAYIALKRNDLSESSIVSAALRGFFCWAVLVALCGFASRHLRFSNGFLRYANEAVLPFYILHQTVILTVGYYVLRPDTSLWIEYLIIATISFIVIMALYELFIRRFNLLRLLFGLKMLPRPLLAYSNTARDSRSMGVPPMNEDHGPDARAT